MEEKNPGDERRRMVKTNREESRLRGDRESKGEWKRQISGAERSQRG